MTEAGEPGQRGRSEEIMLSPTNLTKDPHSSVRRTIRSIVVVVAIVIVAMWTAVGFSLVTARQAALDDASLQGRNLMIAFREEIAFILRGVEGEMSLIAERMRRERDGFDLYAWSQQDVLVAPGMAQATLIGPMECSNRQRLNPTPARSTSPTARISVSIWTVSFRACTSASQSSAVFQ